MPPTAETVLAARGLIKRFGRVTALAGTDFDLLPGEVLGVIGDNGAGKSSLIKVITGAYKPDEGELWMDGEQVSFFHDPLDARARGIETVYQNLAVSPGLDIASNLFLGRERRRPGFAGSVLRLLDRKGMDRDARREMSALGLLTIQDVNQTVETLSGGQRQGRRRGPGSGVRLEGDHHGRADGGARRQGVGAGARPDPRGAQPWRADRADQPQHAARLRGRRPHPHPAPRATRRRRHAADALGATTPWRS